MSSVNSVVGFHKRRLDILTDADENLVFVLYPLFSGRNISEFHDGQGPTGTYIKSLTGPPYIE